MIRFLLLIGLIILVGYNIVLSLESSDTLLIYSALMSTHTISLFALSWFIFKPRKMGEISNDLVSVIIPIYNQSSMIKKVIASVDASTYKNIEIIAVNDGSTDGTKETLRNLKNKFSRLFVVQKKNGGKRKAIATGFYMSKGKYVVLIDSDSIIDKHAIEEIVKTFEANPTVGGVAGHGKVLNAGKNLLTKCQDTWYDYAFNIRKSFESIFGCVLCCSGCLAAYRRETIARYIPYWIQSKITNSDDRDLTTYAIASPWAKKELAPVSQQLLESMSKYDDAEDRGLTAQTMVDWETVYLPTAIVYTEVPDSLTKYLKQQIRWKKGYIRSNFFVSAFFWRKNPLMATIFYLDLMTTFTAPLIVLSVYFYAPFILGAYWITISYIAGQLFLGFVAGLDYKLRDGETKNWTYKPLMNLFTSVVISWMLLPALMTYTKNQWLTR